MADPPGLCFGGTAHPPALGGRRRPRRIAPRPLPAPARPSRPPLGADRYRHGAGRRAWLAHPGRSRAGCVGPRGRPHRRVSVRCHRLAANPREEREESARRCPRSSRIAHRCRPWCRFFPPPGGGDLRRVGLGPGPHRRGRLSLQLPPPAGRPLGTQRLPAPARSGRHRRRAGVGEGGTGHRGRRCHPDTVGPTCAQPESLVVRRRYPRHRPRRPHRARRTQRPAVRRHPLDEALAHDEGFDRGSHGDRPTAGAAGRPVPRVAAQTRRRPGDDARVRRAAGRLLRRGSAVRLLHLQPLPPPPGDGTLRPRPRRGPPPGNRPGESPRPGAVPGARHVQRPPLHQRLHPVRRRRPADLGQRPVPRVRATPCQARRRGARPAGDRKGQRRPRRPVLGR